MKYNIAITPMLLVSSKCDNSLCFFFVTAVPIYTFLSILLGELN